MIRYCESIFQTKRWKTREVRVGSLGIGGSNPVRIQSMTTSNTRDVQATLEQIMKLADAGCEIVRVTVQGMKEADACEEIKNGLLQKGYQIPLVADIHFFPAAAMRVVDFVDKVRINPGNYADKRASFKTVEYDDVSYALEIAKIEEKFVPLVEKCKKLKKAMRIGTNHGSLSDRIMNRYGDTPQGMVESALEFARICRAYDYHDLVFSMKASNPQVMILAYRLLVAEMMRLGWDYPLHLGVTEAGAGEDGRIKSAMGIGALLLDGLGDTIRVSLTEDAWKEIDPCKRLVSLADSHQGRGIEPFEEKHRNILSVERRAVTRSKQISFHRDGTVFVSVFAKDLSDPEFFSRIGCNPKKLKLTPSSADCLILEEKVVSFAHTELWQQPQNMGISLFSKHPEQKEAIAIFPLEQAATRRGPQNPLSVMLPDFAVEIKDGDDWSLLLDIAPCVIFLAFETNRLHRSRQFFDWLKEKEIMVPVVLSFSYDIPKEDLIVHVAAEYGALFCDGLGEGIQIRASQNVDFLRQLSFQILQAARMRTFKTEFISCPSCGRTLFDLQEVSQKIRARTSHLPGVKIAIMGCIVNGPGEMADADFGYVGSKPGMIDLYVGKQCVEKDIHFAEAEDRLVELLKLHGRWIEPGM